MRSLLVVVLVAMLLGATAWSAPNATAAEAASPGEQATTYARVIKRYGAALRYEPSSDAGIYWIASCNDTFVVISEYAGWWQVALPDGGSAWIGGVRVSVGAYPDWGPDCVYGFTYQVGSTAYAHPTNCLSLRYWPSRDAPYDYCVPYNYAYTVINGPIDVAGEDWTQVWSEGTGSGWVLVDYLSPFP